MKNALEKIPKGLRQQLDDKTLQLRNNCAALYALLEERAAPVKVQRIQDELGIGPAQYQAACRFLLENTEEFYATQDGIVLKKHASEDQRYWHLAWSLGIFQVSGRHLKLDQDLLKRAPDDVRKLVEEGRLKEPRRLLELQEEAQKARSTLALVLQMYREVENILRAASRKQVKSKDWKDGLKKIKKELRKNE